MHPSVPVNAAAALCALTASAIHLRHSGWRKVLRFFTIQSNLFCAAACLTVAVFRLAGTVPGAVLYLKYAGTVSVTLTMLTVLIYLGPLYGYRPMFAGPDLWLHLLCPVMALLSFLLWDKPAMPVSCILQGVLPILAYGALYLWKTVLAPAASRWEDFYGFNHNGRWKTSFALMAAAGLAIALALWAV